MAEIEIEAPPFEAIVLRLERPRARIRERIVRGLGAVRSTLAVRALDPVLAATGETTHPTCGEGSAA